MFATDSFGSTERILARELFGQVVRVAITFRLVKVEASKCSFLLSIFGKGMCRLIPKEKRFISALSSLPCVKICFDIEIYVISEKQAEATSNITDNKIAIPVVLGR